MKILMSHRYFWPDTAPYAILLRAIAEDLTDIGHDVHIFASIPSYRNDAEKKPLKRETKGSLSIRRCWVFQEEGAPNFIRAVNVVLYTFGLFFRILILKPKVVTASTFPPVFAAYMAALGSKIVGARFIYHMQDIHPEVSEFAGGMMGKSWFGKIFRWLDNQTIQRATKVVVLSKDMANTIKTRNLGEIPIHIINNFALGSVDVGDSVQTEYSKSEGKFRIVFAGNLGRFQNLERLTEGVVLCLEQNPSLELVFLGDGKFGEQLKEKWSHHAQIEFVPFLPFEEAKWLIADADIGLVSLEKDIYKVAYPSKVMTYLGMGVPILALVEPESELAKNIENHGLGAVPGNAMPEEISRTLSNLVEKRTSKQQIKAWYELEFSRQASTREWKQMLGAASNEDCG